MDSGQSAEHGSGRDLDRGIEPSKGEDADARDGLRKAGAGHESESAPTTNAGGHEFATPEHGDAGSCADEDMCSPGGRAA